MRNNLTKPTLDSLIFLRKALIKMLKAMIAAANVVKTK